MNIKNSALLLTTALVAMLLLTGCQPSKPAALSNDQVVAVMVNILESINAGDYTAFTQDFSSTMMDAITLAQFTGLKALLHVTSGQYVSCSTAPQLSNSQSYAVYRLSCDFELEPVIVTVTIKTGGTQVEGLYFDSTNLRKFGQKTPIPTHGP